MIFFLTGNSRRQPSKLKTQTQVDGSLGFDSLAGYSYGFRRYVLFMTFLERKVMSNSASIIKNLREEGFRVYIRHQREMRNVWVNASRTTKVLEQQISPRGGVAVVEIIDPETNQSFVGTCKSHSDMSYNKKVCSAIALGRALKQMEKAFEQ